tara:strand:- start:6424 stop:7116 length:693 start_codon:yes stop_codon:yes gene_type:complete
MAEDREISALRARIQADPEGKFTEFVTGELGPGYVDKVLGITVPPTGGTVTGLEQLAATQPTSSSFFNWDDIDNFLQSLRTSPESRYPLAGLLAPAAEVGRDPELGTFNPITGEYDPRGGYDPETPIGFGKGRPSRWGNEMLEARRAQLQAAIDSYNDPIKIGGVSLRHPVQTAWNWGAGLLGISDEDQLREVEAEQQARTDLGLEEERRMQQGQSGTVSDFNPFNPSTF